MKPTVYSQDIKNETDRDLSNAEKVIKRLADFGKMNKWNIQKKTNLPYPRVHETVTILEKNRLVRVVGETSVRNTLLSKEYGVTFKGFLTFLSLIDLEHPNPTVKAGESKEDSKKRYGTDLENHIKTLRHLHIVFKRMGEDLDYAIFREIDWLINNYKYMIFYSLVNLAKTQRINQPNFFSAMKKRQKLEDRNLSQIIEELNKAPSLQKMVFYRDYGKENRETEEFNVLRNVENKLEQLRIEMKRSTKSENEYWKKSFADDFFESLSYLRKDKKDRNETLAKLVKELVEKRRKNLTPLERLLKKLEEGK